MYLKGLSHPTTFWFLRYCVIDMWPDLYKVCISESRRLSIVIVRSTGYVTVAASCARWCREDDQRSFVLKIWINVSSSFNDFVSHLLADH